mmetsp:Transcript_147696/g.411355  ORF Transcript_147696/g.411355 Transcript_147696/m.411355 type:complete len:303 (-) Transcript_147696:422-1330(-)
MPSACCCRLGYSRTVALQREQTGGCSASSGLNGSGRTAKMEGPLRGQSRPGELNRRGGCQRVPYLAIANHNAQRLHALSCRFLQPVQLLHQLCDADLQPAGLLAEAGPQLRLLDVALPPHLGNLSCRLLLQGVNGVSPLHRPPFELVMQHIALLRQRAHLLLELGRLVLLPGPGLAGEARPFEAQELAPEVAHLPGVPCLQRLHGGPEVFRASFCGPLRRAGHQELVLELCQIGLRASHVSAVQLLLALLPLNLHLELLTVILLLPLVATAGQQLLQPGNLLVLLLSSPVPLFDTRPQAGDL